MNKLKRLLKFLPFIVIIAFLAYMIMFRLNEQQKNELAVKRTLNLKFKNVQVQQLRKGDIVDYIWAQGKCKPIKTLLIKSEISKKLTKIYVKLGQWVRQGDLMFCFDENDAVVHFIDAKSAFQKANATLEYQKKDYLNKLELSNKGFNEITEDVLNKAKLSYDTAAATLAQAQAGLDWADTELHKTLIFAPFTGIVTELFYETENELVGMNSPLARLSDLSMLKVSVGLATDDVTYINTGRKINKIDVGRKNFDVVGEITGISSQADDSGTFTVQAIVKNPNFKQPVAFIESFGYEERGADLRNEPRPEPRLIAPCKAFEYLKIKPKLPPLNNVKMTPDILLGNEVCRIRIDKSIIKDSFIVPASAIVRVDGMDYICVVEQKQHPITTFGQQDVTSLALAKFIPVKVQVYVNDEAVVNSNQLAENIWLVVDGQKSLKSNDTVMMQEFIDN